MLLTLCMVKSVCSMCLTLCMADPVHMWYCAWPPLSMTDSVLCGLTSVWLALCMASCVCRWWCVRLHDIVHDWLWHNMHGWTWRRVKSTVLVLSVYQLASADSRKRCWQSRTQISLTLCIHKTYTPHTVLILQCMRVLPVHVLQQMKCCVSWCQGNTLMSNSSLW